MRCWLDSWTGFVRGGEEETYGIASTELEWKSVDSSFNHDLRIRSSSEHHKRCIGRTTYPAFFLLFSTQHDFPFLLHHLFRRPCATRRI